jgi:hypothetical protein
MTPEQLTALKTELTTDPASIGYAALKDDHEALAKRINNAPRQVGNAGDKPTSVLLNVFDLAELKAALVVPGKASLLQLVCSMPSVDLDSKDLRAIVADVFGSPSKTLTAFNKLAKRDGKRAEELKFGHVTESDVADALLRT